MYGRRGEGYGQGVVARVISTKHLRRMVQRVLVNTLGARVSAELALGTRIAALGFASAAELAGCDGALARVGH